MTWYIGRATQFRSQHRPILEYYVNPNGTPSSISHPSAISVRNLRKVYEVSERESGLKAAVGSLFHRKTREVAAVRDISFEIAPGEIVGFLGPNGAGKTTTLKMLAGLLHPTSGAADVLGYTPWTRDRDYLQRMALIMGQRNQLTWDIPVLDSYELNKAIFRIPEADFRQRRDELIELLDLGEIMKKPVRNLSLGERMKCEIAGSLLHSPTILFLDEPTIGLDVAMQRRIRQFVTDYNRRTGASILLTSHYMADVEALCNRVIVIHHGALLYDGDLPGLVRTFSPHKTIVVEFEEGVAPAHDEAALRSLIGGEGEIVEASAIGITIRVPKLETARVTTRILAALPVADLTVEDPPIEEVIERVFSSGRDEGEEAPAELATPAGVVA
ncbi:MAG: ATP-binding cassette domain-containing protein [Chloroflexota bacterium]|nr:ATP-binding cassette domain-containing protein [Chloroflexota bacterium]